MSSDHDQHDPSDVDDDERTRREGQDLEEVGNVHEDAGAAVDAAGQGSVEGRSSAPDDDPDDSPDADGDVEPPAANQQRP